MLAYEIWRKFVDCEPISRLVTEFTIYILASSPSFHPISVYQRGHRRSRFSFPTWQNLVDSHDPVWMIRPPHGKESNTRNQSRGFSKLSPRHCHGMVSQSPVVILTFLACRQEIEGQIFEDYGICICVVSEQCFSIL